MFNRVRLIIKKIINYNNNKSSGTSERAVYIDSSFRLSGQLKDHVLGEIVTGIKKNPTKTYMLFKRKSQRNRIYL